MFIQAIEGEGFHTFAPFAECCRCEGLRRASSHVFPRLDTELRWIKHPAVVLARRTCEAEQRVLFEPVNFSLRLAPWGQGKCIHLEGLEVSRLQIKPWREEEAWEGGWMAVTESVMGQNKSLLDLQALLILQTSCAGNISFFSFFLVCILSSHSTTPPEVWAFY